MVYGSGRLVVAVVRQLRANHPDAEIVLVCSRPPTGRRLLPLGVEWKEGPEDVQAGLNEADLATATCALMLDEDDEKNLRAVIATRKIDEDVPLVVHTFDPEFADLLEHHPGRFPIRRAYSMAGLAAPFFVAQALAKTNLVTMRFGSVEIPIVHLEVKAGSPLAATPVGVRNCGCELIAHRSGPEAQWQLASAEDPALEPGAEAVVGGPRSEVFRLAHDNARADEAGAPEWVREMNRNALQIRDYLRNALRILVPNRATKWLIGVLAAGVAAFSLAHGTVNPSDWIYAVVRTGLGEQDYSDAGSWLQIVGTFTLVVGGILFALIVARMTTEATTKQIVPSVRVNHLKDHVVVAGVGEVGYRIANLLHEAGIEYAAICPTTDDRFVEALSGPVLTGDIRLEENLRKVGVERAACLIACSEGNLANVEACIRAERVAEQAGRSISTVARIFDDDLAENAAAALGIDITFAAADKAAPAFVDAATDETAARPFALPGGGEMLGLRHTLGEAMTAADIEDLGRRRLRLIAHRRGATRTEGRRIVLSPVHPARDLPDPAPGTGVVLNASDAVVLVGSRAEVERFSDEVARRGPVVHDPEPLLER